MPGTYARILSRITLDSSQFSAEIRKVQRQAAATAAKMSSIGSTLTNAFTLPVGIGAAFSLKNFGEYESLQKSLSTLEPSMAAVQKRLETLREIARQPGLTFEEAVKGDVRLRSVGIAAEQSARILKEFGNAIAQTGGGGEELSRVTVQLGQLSAKGKVFAQDLKPIIEAAPVVGKALKEMFGTVDSESIQKQLAATGKNSNDFINDLLNQLSKGPRVAGGFKNAMENARDGIFVFTAKIGESINKAFGLESRLNNLTESLGVLTDKWNSLNPNMQKFILGAGGATAATGPLLIALGKIVPIFTSGGAFSKGVGLLKKFGAQLFKMRALGGPIALIGTIIAANWNNIVAFVKESVQGFQNLYKESESFRNVVDASVSFVQAIGKGIGIALANVEDLAKLIGGSVIGLLRSAGTLIKGLFTGKYDFNAGTFKEFDAALVSIKNRALDAWDSIMGIATSSDIREGNEKLKAQLVEMNGAFAALNKTTSVYDNFGKKAKTTTGEVATKTDAVAEAMKKYNDALRTNATLSSVLGSGYDVVSENLSAVESVIKELAGEGSKRALSIIGGLTGKLSELRSTVASNEIGKAFSAMSDELGYADAIWSGFEQTAERVGAKMGIVQGAIEDLIKKGVDAADPKIQVLRKTLTDLKNTVDFTIGGVRVQIKEGGIVEGFNKMGEALKPLNERMLEFTKLKMENAFVKINAPLEKTTDVIELLSRNIAGLVKNIGDGLGGAAQEIAKAISFSISAISNIVGQSFTNREASLDNYYAKEKKYIESSQLSEEAKTEALKKLDADVETKRKKIARDKAKSDKAAAIFNATLAGANAILSALTIPPPLGQVFAGIIGGLVASQIGVIASQPLPALAKGGLAHKPITAVVGDNPNARYDPEVISPLSKLKKLIEPATGGVMELHAVIRGNDLYLIGKQNEYRVSRTGV